MIIEHLFYSGALAVVMGMIYHRFVPNDSRPYAWIIVLSSYAPDLIPDVIHALSGAGIPVSILTKFLRGVGLFSYEASLVVYMIIIGLFLFFLRWNIVTSALFAGIGYGAHLAEDALIDAGHNRTFWSFLSQAMGLGSYTSYGATFFGIASTPVLMLGIGLFLAAVGIRVALDGMDWIRHPFGSNPNVAVDTIDK